MRVSENQVFNLMDTNGRRNDVIYALQGYLEILDYVMNVKRMKWKSLPESLAQLEFYKQAIEFSPDVFKKHDKFDKVMEMVEQHPMLKAAIQRNNIEWIQKNYPATSILFAQDPDDGANGAYYSALGGVGDFPMTIIVDKDGVITFTCRGSITHEELVDAVEDALAD